MKSCERFSITKESWEPIAFLNCARCTSNAITYKNSVYVFGGYYGKGRIREIERYNLAKNKWELVQMSLKIPIEGAELIMLNQDEILIFGGKNQYGATPIVTSYDLDSCHGTIRSTLIVSHVLPKAAFYDDKIVCFGGTGNDDLLVLDIKENNWEKKFVPDLGDIPNMGKASFAQSY